MPTLNVGLIAGHVPTISPLVTHVCISLDVYRSTATSATMDQTKLHPSHDTNFAHFPSRRSTVFSAKGAVATSQPLGESLARRMSRYQSVLKCTQHVRLVLRSSAKEAMRVGPTDLG